MEPPTEEDWCEFEKQLGTNSSSVSGTPSKFEFEKIYVISEYAYGEDCEYRVYCIHLNASETPPPLEPIIIWDQFYHYNFAVAFLGSRMYMFGGCKDDDFWEKSMYFYDLASAPPGPGPIRLEGDNEESLLQPGSDMSGRKCVPVAVVIGDSKICVFGTALGLLYPPLSSLPYFELYDTVEDDWKTLPEPLEYDWCGSFIGSYCVHGSCLIIQIDGHGIYGINVDHPDPKWVILGQSDWFQDFSFAGLWTMVGKQLYSPFHVMRREDVQKHEFALQSSPPHRESLIAFRPKGVLCSGGANLLFILRSGFLSVYTPSLLVDIVRFDDDGDATPQELGSDGLSKWKEIQSDLSLTLSFSHPSHHMKLLACFPIKAAALEPGAHLSSLCRS